MFIDVAQVVVKAGDGGRGAVSFRHEIYVDRGGPDGGDGGDGGDVVFLATNNINALQSFRYKQKLKAPDGEHGSKQKRHGRSGQERIVKVPIGTVVYLEGSETPIADLGEDGKRARIAEGGKGGFGNAHFKTSTRQAPKVAEKGAKGQLLELRLELKLLADVGLVGLPNAGKSTFLSVVSDAKPKIANYPFTTLSPNLGVADIKQGTLLLADIPGLIEGASEGKGLGDDFLRHIERTKVLLHMIDAYSDDVVRDYTVINKELENYQIDLSTKPQLIALTKIDGLDDEIVADQVAKLSAITDNKIYSISSLSGSGTNDLLVDARKLVEELRNSEQEELEDEEGNEEYETVTIDESESWDVQVVESGGFKVSGKKIESFASRTDFNNEWGVSRLKAIMRKMGITHALTRAGARVGDEIIINEDSFEF